MPAPIALQLYTLREAAARDFEAAVRSVAGIGYLGVEPAGFPGTTPEGGKRLFDDLGLEVCSAHLPLPAGETLSESLETAEALGIERVISGRGPDQFSSLDRIAESCDLFNEAAANCAGRGFTFGIHNHWWEFLEVEGEPAYRHLLGKLSPDVIFQIDAYWVQTAGARPCRGHRRAREPRSSRAPEGRPLHARGGHAAARGRNNRLRPHRRRRRQTSSGGSSSSTAAPPT